MSKLTRAQAEAVFSRSRMLYSGEEADAALAKIAEEITHDLAAENPILLCVMNGGLVTSGKLATLLAFPLEIDYCHATRYREAVEGSKLRWLKRPNLSLKDRVVIVVDDILDQGATLDAIVTDCKSQGAATVLTAVLTEKIHDRKLSAIKADYKGLELEDAYVFGYGLDYKGYWRNANGIYAIDESDY